MESNKERIKQWKYSRAVYLPHQGQTREAPEPGEVFRQSTVSPAFTAMVAGSKESQVLTSTTAASSAGGA